jgi:xylulokinase
VGNLTAGAAREYGLLEGTPVIAGAGDAPCALIGSGAVDEGDGHVCLGTSGWVGVTTKRTPRGKCGVATIQSADPDKAFLIAETEAAGACLQWLADEMYGKEKIEYGVPDVYAFMDREVAEVPPGSNCVLFTPWLYGERAPVDDCYVRAAFFNLSAEHRRRDMLRAVYEGVAYNIRWLVEIVEKEFKFPLPVLRVIGGGAKSKPWMQILADVTKRRVEAVANPQEAGAVGAALVAGVGLGIYRDFASLKKVVRIDGVFQPRAQNSEVYDSLFDAYKEVYRSLRQFYSKLNRERFNRSV